MRRILRTATALVVIGCAGGLGWSYMANRSAHSPAEIEMLTDRLFEFGSVSFVHNGYTGPHVDLFDCVRAGNTLTKAQSALYRSLYQGVLYDRQALFSRLDQDLQLRENEGMTKPNNTGGYGILGMHDHHDASATRNAASLWQALEDLAQAGLPERVVMANDIYKDLTDLMVHMAPAVHSVGLIPFDEVPEGVPASYTAFYSAMKAAQVAPINGPLYWTAIDAAQNAYAEMVLDVQRDVRRWNGAAAHMLSGRWLALQTIAPRLSYESPASASRRTNAATTCPASPS